MKTTAQITIASTIVVRGAFVPSPFMRARSAVTPRILPL